MRCSRAKFCVGAPSPELPIAPGITLHMRALPFAVWGRRQLALGRRTPTTTQARAQRLHRGPHGFHTPPLQDLRWLLVVTAVGRNVDVDTEGAEMHAGKAYLLSWEQATARWRPSSLPRNVAHQYYYDWGDSKAPE